MRLRTKYALVLLGILLVLGTVVVGSAELFKQETIDREQQDLEETTELTAQQIDNELDDKLDLVFFFGARDDVDQFEDSGVLLRQLVESSEFFAAELIDEDGELVDLQGEAIPEEHREAAIGTDVSDREDVVRALDGQRETVSPPNQTQDHHTLRFTAPIWETGEGEPSGAIAATLFLEESSIFDPTGPMETTIQTVHVTGERADGEEGILLQGDGDFENALTSTWLVEETGWLVTIERDETALTEQLQFLQYIQLGSLFVVFLAIMGLGVYEYRTTLRQTGRLLEGFSELTEGNYDHTLEMTEADEWEKIGDGFNEMSTGLKRREQQIAERERRLSVLNRILRHNLQNDMTVIQGHAEIMPVLDDKEEREEAAEKILEMSRGLIDHGKKARNLQTVMENAEEEPVTIDVVEKTDQLLSGYERDYSDVEVEREFPEETWVSAVSGVKFGIKSIVENAFQHNDSGEPKVVVSIRVEDDEVCVDVRDNGSGVPEHEIDVLEKDEETSLEHGSGIGMWLSYWAAEKSDGELRFGTSPEGGALVTMALPAAERPDHADEEDEFELSF